MLRARFPLPGLHASAPFAALAAAVVAAFAMIASASAAESPAPSFPARPIPAGPDTAARFLKLIDRPRTPAEGTRTEVAGVPGLRRFSFSYATEPGQRVPGLWTEPDGPPARRPVVVALHGTGGSKENERAFLEKLARRGFVGIAIDARHHGQRAGSTNALPGADAYLRAIHDTWRTGRQFPFLYDTVWDVLRLIDWLETQPGIDPKRIALTGVSKGGMETYLAAAVDGRVAAAVPFIGVQSYQWALENDAWRSRVGTIQSAVNGAARDAGSPVDAAFVRRFYERVVPGVHAEFDGPQMLPLIAPRPLLVVNGDSDPRTPVPGVERCAAAARRAYAALGAGDRFELLLQKDTGHDITPEAEQRAIEWLVRWMHP